MVQSAAMSGAWRDDSAVTAAPRQREVMAALRRRHGALRRSDAWRAVTAVMAWRRQRRKRDKQRDGGSGTTDSSCASPLGA